MKSMPIDEIEFVAFDTETTGLEKGSRIVEIGGIRFYPRGRSLPSFSTLVNPQIPIPQEVYQIHKIHDVMVQDQPAAEQVLKDFFDYAQDAVLVAHNLSFDLKILEGEIERLGLQIPRFYCLDTLTLARKWIPGLASYRLSRLAEYFQIRCQNFHRALDDAQVVRQVLEALIEKIAQKKGKIPLLGEVIEGSEMVSFPSN